MSESVHSSPRKSDGGSSIRTHRTSGEQSMSNSEPALTNNTPVRRLTAYEKYMEEMNNDPRALKEVTLGKRIAFYKIRNELGSGNFSQVKMGLHALTKEKVAIKILDKTKLDQKTQRLLSREISCMERLHHPNIIRLYEVVETLAKLHLVMEYAPGGELFTKISNEGKIAEAECKPIFAQVTSAVYHMHSKNIIHRDLKAENVFYAANGYVKVGDFGFSTYCKMSDTLNTFCGSPPYAAPELFKDENYIGPPVDTWALGIMLYFMMTGVMPFRADTVAKLKKCILDGQFTIPSYVSSNGQLLIRGVLKQPPPDRYTIDQIKSSQWLQGQEYPPPHPSYHLTPCFRRESASNEEINVLDQLKALGIKDDQLESTRDQDSRNSITGTYRIALHRLQRKRLEPPVQPPPQQTKGKTSRPSSKKKSKDSNKNNKPSKLCTIL
ncbi:serine/threonine-protein kinase NIM1 [Strongylocentrotus purpuratus]|uniref:Serine/threonine-protein kinase NIM1 n=1 Tax=Strongylocentrotus purpuratus TaxID=7668 RepID=A0A7M7T3X1_STRPU|nr:serine/threonine-protein kinase NIM1 [Strongylocentrotus purpuratus]XP_030852009.1 serine/threonine-protein kinase NIM1 [Strongylocentrotus purpuratus]XP_783422.2 serine/threonine-protein kinase NIM1 [Strongylocentrotus purpuratus]|eukprot:XP_003726741.1 PREDICTED: serine/threonine-protein kinase NIM1 [Strongylocentrotus purpuratus]